MPLGRFIVSATPLGELDYRNSVVNTLYFNITTGPIDPTGWQNLVNDLHTLWASKPWSKGTSLDIRAYDMDDAEPRPQKARKVANVTGVRPNGTPQVALALSYYADKNQPRFRGRIFLGPWANTNTSPAVEQQNAALGLCDGLAGLGGINVDWSLYSPTRNAHERINHAWVDNSWDIIRSRKLRGTSRVTWSGDG